MPYFESAQENCSIGIDNSAINFLAYIRTTFKGNVKGPL